MLIFHVATEADWAAAVASGAYDTSTVGVRLQDAGFIHASRASQTAAVLARFYARIAEPLVLLTIDTDLLAVAWRFDQVADQRFPHIYGPLNPSAVIAATALTRDDDGQWRLPTSPASS